MTRRSLILIAATIGLAVFSPMTAACQFYFTYASIIAPLGTEGEIGVRVQKTHALCTMTDPLDYDLAASNVQILSQTAWTEVGPNLYETWLRVSLSAVGDGFLRISKTCSKEGYGEAVLPVTVTSGDEGGPWAEALAGTYPFAAPDGAEVLSAKGEASTAGGVVTVGEVAFSLPVIPEALAAYAGTLRVYYVAQATGAVPLLVVGDSLFLRLDPPFETVS
jgi:hypothetical protein